MEQYYATSLLKNQKGWEPLELTVIFNYLVIPDDDDFCEGLGVSYLLDKA